MAKLSDLRLDGQSGQEYSFGVYPFGTTFKAIGAVYAITKREESGDTFEHTVIYVGSTGDMSERFDAHHKANCFKRYQANCICIHQDGDEESRKSKEIDLIHGHRPPCNG